MKLLAVGLICLLCGCSATKPVSNEVVPVGWFDQEQLKTSAYPAFKARYDTVQVEQQFVGLIGQVHDSIEAIVFFGTWCGDSKREVPGFLRIVEQANFPRERIKFYALDRTKKSPDGLTDQYGIERVATFIFLKRGIEVGRITEKPSSTLEADMLSILAEAADK
ncbi:MAG: thioredoxin family protein [Bacteroidota bacterium]